MRKQIIKFFALDYKVFIFERVISWTRPANIIFPLMLLCGLLTISDNIAAYYLLPIAYSLLVIALFFGFVYFRIKPLKETDYDYFDEVQKFMWDYKNFNEPEPLKRYNSSWVFWVNPLATVLFLTFYFL